MLLGLPPDLDIQLTRVLRAEAHTVVSRRFSGDLRRGPRSAVVFIAGQGPGIREEIAALRYYEPDVPIVAVTRIPETKLWLDALEAGAADYCGGPFERIQIRWIMSTVLGPAVRQAA
jgi:DNA-binding response OmpR family regulator